MGACASFPRGLKPLDASDAPAPEPAPEQSVKGANVEGTEEVKLEQDEQKDDEANQPSLGSLLDEKEATEDKNLEAEQIPAMPNEEEHKTKEAPTTPNNTEETKDSMEKIEREGKKDY